MRGVFAIPYDDKLGTIIHLRDVASIVDMVALLEYANEVHQVSSGYMGYVTNLTQIVTNYLGGNKTGIRPVAMRGVMEQPEKLVTPNEPLIILSTTATRVNIRRIYREGWLIDSAVGELLENIEKEIDAVLIWQIQRANDDHFGVVRSTRTGEPTVGIEALDAPAGPDKRYGMF